MIEGLDQKMEMLNAEDTRRAIIILDRARSTTFEPERNACIAALNRIFNRYDLDEFSDAINNISNEQFDLVLVALDYLGVYMSDLADDYIWLAKGNEPNFMSEFNDARKFHCFNWAYQRFKKLNDDGWHDDAMDRVRQRITITEDEMDDMGWWNESVSETIFTRVLGQYYERQYRDLAARLVYAFKIYYQR